MVGVAYTYNEPLVAWEYVRDCAELVRAAGLSNVLVSAGCVCAQVVDEVHPVASDQAIATKQRLAAEAGLLVGISAGAAVAAALDLDASGAYAGQTIVAILPDTGERYLSMDL